MPGLETLTEVLPDEIERFFAKVTVGNVDECWPLDSIDDVRSGR